MSDQKQLNTKHLEAIKTIQQKLLGKKVSYREILNLMDEISHHRLNQILTTYFVASSFKEGFSAEELYHFTKAMVETGTQLKFDGIVADKHSIGGLSGTRATMIVVPIIAAAGFKIPKTSSRAITTPAGTADVMELLCSVNFTPQQAHDIVEKTGGCIIWNGKLGLAPADDIIIHVEAPLMFESFDKIIISIMAKKIAMSTNHLVLDLPVGKTMKVKHISDAEKVGKKFIALGKHFGMKVIVDISEAHEPGGNGVGAFLEAKDVLAVLEQRPDRPLKLEEKSLRLAGKLLDICYEDSHQQKDGLQEAKRILSSGTALLKFKEIVKAQGGNEDVSWTSLKSPAQKLVIKSSESGRVTGVNNYNLNTLAKILGAPAEKYAGIFLLKKIGDNVKHDEPILEFYSCNSYKMNEAAITLENFPVYQVE